jgi:hypothetical protein
MLKRLLLFGLLGALLAPGAAHAASPATAFGPRVGLSIDPDQLVLGGQMMIGDLAPDVTLNPSLEFGFGDDATVIALNIDGEYHFRVQGSPWRPYVGFGLGINFIEFDRPAPFDDVSDTEVGANLIVGAGVPTRSNNRFFTEIRFGIGNIPELKIMAGWLFPL